MGIIFKSEKTCGGKVAVGTIKPKAGKEKKRRKKKKREWKRRKKKST